MDYAAIVKDSAIAGTAFSMPWWAAPLNETASLVAAIGAVILVGLRIYATIRDLRKKRRRAGDPL